MLLLKCSNIHAIICFDYMDGMIVVATVSVSEVAITVTESDDDEVILCATYTGPSRLVRDIIITFDTKDGTAFGKPVV